MDECARCTHKAVCKYLMDAMETVTKVKELNDRDLPIKVQLECKQFRPRTTNIKELSDGKTALDEG